MTAEVNLAGGVSLDWAKCIKASLASHSAPALSTAGVSNLRTLLAGRSVLIYRGNLNSEPFRSIFPNSEDLIFSTFVTYLPKSTKKKKVGPFVAIGKAVEKEFATFV